MIPAPKPSDLTASVVRGNLETATRPAHLAAAGAESSRRLKRMPSQIESPEAARRMEDFIEHDHIGFTEFAIKAGTTDRTLMSFRKTGRVRRRIFAGIAYAMGTTPEELLANL